MTALLFIFFRAIKLFYRFFRSNLTTVLALSGIFLISHMGYIAGGSAEVFVSSFIRFDVIRVYSNTPDDSKYIINHINTDSRFTNITYFSSKDTRQLLIDSSASLEGLMDLPEDYFPEFIELTLDREYHSKDSFLYIVNYLKSFDGVKNVSYGERLVEKLTRAKNSFISILKILAIIFILVDMLVVFQSISLILYKYKNEILIYGIVGGTKTFIVAPFIFMSLILGFMAYIISLFLLYTIKYLYIIKIERIINLNFFLPNIYYFIFPIIVCIICGVSSFISVIGFINGLRDETTD